MAKLLIIEDDPVHALLYQEMIGDAAYEHYSIEVAPTLQKGVQLLQKQQYDLILTDLSLPDSHGIETVAQVLKAAAGRPVVVLSADDSPTLTVEAVRMGAQDYLIKGTFDGDTLARVVRYAIERQHIRLELEASEAKYRLLVEQLPVITYVTEPSISGRTLFISRQVETVLGFAPERFLTDQSSWIAQVHPDDRDSMVKARQSGRAKDEPFRLEYRVIDAEGRVRWVLDETAYVHDSSGKRLYVQGVITDITRERERFNKVIRSEQYYRGVFDNLSDAVLVLHPESAIVLDANEIAERLFGFSRGELISTSMEERAQDASLFRRQLDTIVSAGKSASTRFETTQYGKDANTLYLDVTATMIDVAGRQAVMLISRDITDRKLAEQMLRDSEATLMAVWESSGDAMVLSDPQGIVLKANPAYSQFYGLPLDEIVGNSYAIIFPPEQRAWATEGYRTAFVSESNFDSTEVEVRGPDGQMRIVEARYSFLMRDGQRFAMLSVIRDITQRKRAEEKVRKSEQRFATAFHACPVAMTISSLENGRLVDANERALSLFGYSREEMVGHLSADLGLWSDEQERAEVIRLVKTQGYIRDHPSSLRRKDSQLLDTVVAMQVILINDEPCTISSILDITEQRQAEAARRRSEELFAKAFRASPAGMSICRLSDGLYMDANDSFLQTVGFEREEIIGHTREEFKFWAGIKNHAELAEITSRQGALKGVEARIRTKSGEFRDTLSSLELIEIDGEICMITNGIDITERKRAEEAVRESESRFRAIFENSLEAMYILDQEARVVEANGAAAFLYDLPISSLIGTNISELIAPNEQDHIWQVWQQLIVNGELQMEIATITHANRSIEVEVSARANFLPGYHLVILRDISARKQAEREHLAREAAERANLANGEFLSRMSHELRTPLNAILGFGELLLMEEEDKEQQESAEHILSAGQHLLALINDVLDLSRIQSGQLSLSVEPTEADEVLQESLDLIRASAEQRHIEILSNVEGLSECRVLADRQRLRQVLLNMLSNAVKYNRDDGFIQVSAIRLVNNRVRIIVRDHGLGVAPEKLSRLFTPFDRLGAETSRVEGTGLGLAISKQLMEAMGGQIGASSKVGEGSTFWIEITEAPPSRNEPSMEELSAAANLSEHATAEPDKHTLLYIEDNPASLELVKRLIRRRPEIRLLSAHSGLGYELAQQHKVDLILLDLHLPDISGEEALRRLRLNPLTSQIPTVIFSADASAATIARLREAGADDYLTKPIDVKRFYSLLDEQLAAGNHS